MPKKRSTRRAAKEPMFPLKLTQHQRKAMLHATRLRPKIKNRVKNAPDGTQVVEFTRTELDAMNEELGTAAIFAPRPDKKRLVAVQKKIDGILDAISEDPARPKRRRPADPSDVLFQFKITLLDIEPPIWRRFQVEDATLADLHDWIQAAMGWWNYHLHQFLIEGERYGPPPPDDIPFDLEDLETEDETNVWLSDLLPKSGRRTRWIYEYDFGDGWQHEVVFEGYPPRKDGQRYPVCLDGERACPPEDVGGPWGYAEYLKVLSDPNHEHHEDLLQWRGPFDPKAFDAEEATREMQQAASDRRD